MKGIIPVQEDVKSIVADGVRGYEFAVMRYPIPAILPVSPHTKITADHAFFLAVA